MKLAGYDFEGPFTDLSKVKDLPGVYIVLNFGILDVGESGSNYREGGQGMRTRLSHHDRKPAWELAIGKGKGRASEWPETLAACDAAFSKETLENKCQEHGLSSRGDKKELCARLYGAGDKDVVDLMEKRLQTLREELLGNHPIENIAYAVHYEPDDQKRSQIEQALHRCYKSPCGGDGTPQRQSSVSNK